MAAQLDLVAHMRRVQQAERDLRDLGLVWRMIESSAAISCPDEVAPLLPTLSHTRHRFDDLQIRLVTQLAEASRAQVGDELAAKAQCTIDILVRNLYERTADVGFLATDDTLRAFCAAAPDERDTRRAAIVRRLGEYQSKYTVYDDIVLLATDGSVLARLADAGPVPPLDAATAPWLPAVLARDGWTEHHGPSPLAAGAAPALLYVHRIVDGTRPTGVLVLRFRLADELARIFSTMADARGQIALLLLDGDDRVIASNDPAHVPLDARLRPLADGEVAVTTFAGREYLAVQCATRGYQGYAGPGWRARAMVSLLTAFAGGEADDADEVPLDDGGLKALQADADAINRELRRVVWNGQLMARRHQGDSVRLKAVLTEVNRAGQSTRERVSTAVRDLYRSSLQRARTHAAQLSSLAADILDRNLYERANDCRWWALSPALKSLLAAPADGENAAAIGAVLDHVNALYTVYSRLVVFDAAGLVRGLSRAGGTAVTPGTAVDPGWVEAVQRLNGPQQFAVTPFEDTPLHDAGPTLTYLAAITDGDGGPRLGGIAIVFNARDELAAMLRDVVGERAGFAAFVGADGQLLATTDASVPAVALKRAGPGGSLLTHGDACYACTRRAGTGYREYRSPGIEVVVGLRLGPQERRRSALVDRALLAQSVARREERLELAVFQVGAGRYALPAAWVHEAQPREGIVRTPGGHGAGLGLLEARADGQPALVRVLCARDLFGLAYPPRTSDGVVLVLTSREPPHRPVLGLRVDEVLGITEVPRSSWQASPLRVCDTGHARVLGIVDCLVSSPDRRPEKVLVQVLDPLALVRALLPFHADTGVAADGLAALAF